MSIRRVVAITGCDSGLGWALAARMAREGIVTVAGMHQGPETEAAIALKGMCVHPCPLDVKDADSVHGFRDEVMKLLCDNPDYRLYAVVNNAGTMTIGDYEWQRPKMLEDTIDINLLGAMRVISAFLPDLRAAAIEGAVKPRIINVASHCGLQPLPGFAAYSTSKAGLLALTTALRIEQRRYGLSVVAFVPGGFIGFCNLMKHQDKDFNDMLSNLNEEQTSLYGKRIRALKTYLSPAGVRVGFQNMKDEDIIETFMNIINENKPKELYKVENMRYKLYYNSFKLPLPEAVRYWLVKKFINFPEE